MISFFGRPPTGLSEPRLRSRGWRDSGSGSETLQIPDDRLLPIEVGGVWEFHWLVVSDPEPEQCNEDLSIETAGEGKQHECPREDKRIVAQAMNLARYPCLGVRCVRQKNVGDSGSFEINKTFINNTFNSQTQIMENTHT